MSREMASLAEMQRWAEGVMRGKPDFIIGETDPGGAYLLRWHVIPRNALGNVYLHQFLRSDDDRALHDHPWASTSMIISGGYFEHTPDGSHWRSAGETVSRAAEALHRIELAPGKQAVSLFFTGPKVREWGFACPNGWVHWEQFTAAGKPGERGPGCGA